MTDSRRTIAALGARRTLLTHSLFYLAAVLVAHVIVFTVCMDSGHIEAGAISGAFIVLGVILFYLGMAGLERLDHAIYLTLDDDGSAQRQVEEGHA